MAGLILGRDMEIVPNRGFRRMRLEAVQLDDMREFYGGKLGLPTRFEGKALVVQAGGTEMVFEPGPSAPAVYHFAFNIPENRFAEAQDWMRKRTGLVKRENGSETFHFESWNAHAMYFFDPAGNIGELIARHTLPNASSDRFSEKGVLHASELGLVVEDVPKAVATIGKNLGMKPYKGSAPDFTAVGDEHALLIVVKKGRVWFGSGGIPATTHGAEAEIYGRVGRLEVGEYSVVGHP